MPTFKNPTNDNARLTFLRRAAKTAKQDKVTGNTYLSDETIEVLDSFIPKYSEGMNALGAKLSNRSKEVRENEESLSLVKIYVRDCWESIKRRVYRLNLPAEVLSFYELPLNGNVPKPTTREEWMTIAEQIIAGDAEAEQKGYEALREPNRNELQKALNEAIEESSDVATADREYDKEQKVVRELRAVAEELINEIMAELRYFLRKNDESNQRRIMKTYGAMFEYAQGEPIEE